MALVVLDARHGHRAIGDLERLFVQDQLKVDIVVADAAAYDRGLAGLGNDHR